LVLQQAESLSAEWVVNVGWVLYWGIGVVTT
jgi:hypothetical protein